MSSSRLLRQIPIAIFPPALILFIPHGVASNEAFPALGLIPLAISTLLGLLLLYRDKVAGTGSPIQMLSAVNILFADTIVCFLLLACLIPTWVNPGTRYQPSLLVLGTYCTVFLMLSL